MWNNISTKKDIDTMIDIFEGFHDSCITKVNYISGLYIDDCTYYLKEKKSSVEIFFERQSVNNKELCIKFIDILEFNITKKENYIHEIYDISMFIRDNRIYWGDSEEFNLDSTPYNGIWVCSKKAIWKLSEQGVSVDGSLNTFRTE